MARLSTGVAPHGLKEVVNPGKLKHLLHGRLQVEQAQGDGLLANPVVGGLENRHERAQSATVYMTDVREINLDLLEPRRQGGADFVAEPARVDGAQFLDVVDGQSSIMSLYFHGQ